MLNNLFHIRPLPTGPAEFLVVGLGNPGAKYDGTRHNAGFRAVDYIAEQTGVQIDRLKFKGLCARAQIGGKSVLLLKPCTYMNLSGQSVVEAMNFYHIPPEHVIVLYDDISFPPGKLRIRLKGSDGGQNGMKNIIYLTGSDHIPRIRLGTGDRPDHRWDLSDWVLGHLTPEDDRKFLEAVAHAKDAVALIVQGKAAEAMNLYNGN